jgi:hypothetical protein
MIVKARFGALLLGIALAITLATVGSAQSGVTVLGAFMKTRSGSPDHAYGHRVELWQAGETLFGTLTVWDGPAFDVPTVLLEDVRFTPRTGAVTFTARCGAIYRFTGTLTRTALRGTLIEDYGPRSTPTSQQVTLPRSEEMTEFMTSVSITSVDAFRKALDERIAMVKGRC